MRRSVAVTFMVCAFGLALSPCACCGLWFWTPAGFTIRNESGQPIASLVVRVADKEFVFADVPPGGTVSGSFHFSGEATLGVTGQLADGTRIADLAGYVVWEDFAPQIRASVREDGSVNAVY